MAVKIELISAVVMLFSEKLLASSQVGKVATFTCKHQAEDHAAAHLAEDDEDQFSVGGGRDVAAGAGRDQADCPEDRKQVLL